MRMGSRNTGTALARRVCVAVALGQGGALKNECSRGDEHEARCDHSGKRLHCSSHCFLNGQVPAPTSAFRVEAANVRPTDR
jgi:hypothetical protein